MKSTTKIVCLLLLTLATSYSFHAQAESAWIHQDQETSFEQILENNSHCLWAVEEGSFLEGISVGHKVNTGFFTINSPYVWRFELDLEKQILKADYHSRGGYEIDFASQQVSSWSIDQTTILTMSPGPGFQQMSTKGSKVIRHIETDLLSHQRTYNTQEENHAQWNAIQCSIALIKSLNGS
ncbi:MAG: hypothetical protein R3A11_06765 [Bdellovibrionota bacterium]